MCCILLIAYCGGVYLPVNSIVRESVEDVVDDIGRRVIAAQVYRKSSQI